MVADAVNLQPVSQANQGDDNDGLPDRSERGVIEFSRRASRGKHGRGTAQQRMWALAPQDPF